MSNKSKGFDKIRYKTMINERNDQRINAIENLKNACTEENLWQAMTRELWVNRRENSKSLAWSSVVLAFQHARQISEEIPGPKKLGNIRGISYIYAIFWKLELIKVPDTIAEKMTEP